MKIRNIAVIVSGIDEEYPYRIIQGINDFARSHDFNVSYFTAFGGIADNKEFDIGEYSIFKLPNLSKFDGILLLSNTFSEPDIRKMIIDRVKAAKVPVVVFEGSEHEEFYDVSTNNYSAMKELVLQKPLITFQVHLTILKPEKDTGLLEMLSLKMIFLSMKEDSFGVFSEAMTESELSRTLNSQDFLFRTSLSALTTAWH